MTISSATTAPLTLVPPAPDAEAERGLYAANTSTLATLPPAGDAGAGAAAIGTAGGAAVSQQVLIDTLRQALAVLTQLVAQLTGGAGASGGGAVGQQPNQVPNQSPIQAPPMKTPSQVGGANGGPVQKFPTQVSGAHGGPVQQQPGQFPGQTPGQVGGANGGPAQYPVQTPGQYPGQYPGQFPGQFPTQGGGPSTIGGGEVGGVDLSEGVHAVTLEDDNGDSVRIWGDPHVDVKLDGKREKFDIGYGPGEITLRDGTHVSWDTGRGNILSTLSVDRPQGVDGDVDADVNDSTKLKNEATGLTNAQLREFIAELREFEGKPHEPLKRTGAEGGGGPSKK